MSETLFPLPDPVAVPARQPIQRLRYTGVLPRYGDVTDAPLRSVIRVEYYSSDAGLEQHLECGHVMIRPRRSRNFELRRVRCWYCRQEGRTA